jgi:thiamine-phosphate pyrophosphorylase
VDITTLAARGVDPIEFAAAVLVARPAALQLRAKGIEAREVLGLLRALGPLCHRANVPLVANDRADLAALAGCDMVHVGQDDIGVDLVRRLAPSLGVGISTHTFAQLETALATKPTYVAFGPVYPTTSKHAPSPVVGVARLRDAYRAAALAGVPLVATLPRRTPRSCPTGRSNLEPCRRAPSSFIAFSRAESRLRSSARESLARGGVRGRRRTRRSMDDAGAQQGRRASNRRPQTE